MQTEHETEVSHENVGGRAYQPSWIEAIVMSVGISAVLGGVAYFRTDNIVVLELAGAAALPLYLCLRWIWPLYRHLIWGDAED